MWSRLVWPLVLGIATGAAVSVPAATTGVSCVLSSAVSAEPPAISEDSVADQCTGDNQGHGRAFVPTPTITPC